MNNERQKLKLHHVAITVSDMQRSIRFYKRLGFELTSVYDKSEPGAKGASLKLGSNELEMFCFKDSAKNNSRELKETFKIIGVTHFALGHENLDECCKKLKKAGFEVLHEPKTASTGHRYSFIKDPNGIYIELFETKKSQKQLMRKR